MEPVGWVSCGCGKGVNIYARKQEKKQQLKTVLEKVETAVERGEAKQVDEPKVAKTENREKALQQRLCAWCGKPYTEKRTYIKCCSWDCHLKKKEQAANIRAVTALSDKLVPQAELEDPTPVEAPWKTTPEETKDLLDNLER